MGGDDEKKLVQRSDSESGTPDWLRSHRKKKDAGELKENNEASDKGRGKGDKGGKGSKDAKPGDWTCNECGASNFAAGWNASSAKLRSPGTAVAVAVAVAVVALARAPAPADGVR
eukprot:CAMPEP_0197660728 /NCGR_PEP_ID=MMETSP1338-20131121/51029_1 /TAXON_ID=43686 ORGANISM="Pelagodinium beii, Strain RCC1491" /NCGR_SAMPLE_ID=MMETSP1338 /ASSEMBLY_ACC=CAM_ASM_000754 /LENGTH=114 /DNA_ID=CAMNT_0043238149 /DNA_START=73 /DNA_END=418 /DNA_ORIENTATION=-